MKSKERDRTGNPTASAGTESDGRTADEWLAKATGGRSARRVPEDRLRASLAATVRHHHAVYMRRAALGIGLLALAVAIATLILV
ncbi:MAG: hypothetical protein WD270_06170 [Acetobacterales bacterium]